MSAAISQWPDLFYVSRDPNGAMLCFYDMMKKQIVMPAHLMDDNEHQAKTGRNLFKDFSSVAQTTGTYTGQASQYIFPFQHWKPLKLILQMGSCLNSICSM